MVIWALHVVLHGNVVVACFGGLWVWDGFVVCCGCLVGGNLLLNTKSDPTTGAWDEEVDRY